MTSPETPEQYPTEPLESIGADGAFQIGDGFNFGQDYTESIIKGLFAIPTSNLENALGLISQQLLKVPLEVLKIFKDIIPGTLDDDFIDSATAVATIVTSLIANIKLPEFLVQFLTWVWERIQYFLEDFLRPVIDYAVALWNQFIIDWNAVNWSSPLTAIHSAWMLIVDFVFDLGPWILNKIVEVSGLNNAPSFFELDVLRGVWSAFTTEWSAINFSSPTALWAALSAVASLIRGSAHWLAGVFQNLTGIELESLLQSLGLGTLATVFTTWASALAGINWLSPGALMTAIGAFINLFQGIGNWFLALIDSWLGWNTSAVHDMFSSFGNFVERIVQYFFGATGLDAFVQTVEALAGAVGASILDAIKAVFTALRNAAESADGLVNWVTSIPVVGPIVQAITGLASITDLAGLSEWIRTNLLTIASNIPSTQLFGQIPSILLGVIPVSNINDTIVNLVEGEFADGAGLSELQGWEWDDTESATSGSGSAKVICDGNNKELFFQTPVRVAPGDRLTMSTKVKTSLASLPGSQQRLGLWVLNYKGNALGENLPVATRSTGTTSWVEVSGNYTVPAGVTSLIIRLAVEGVAYNGGYVWFDDVDVHKSGSIAQEWVGNLTDTWESVWTGAFGTSGSGKRWFDVGPALTSMTGKTTLAQAAGDGAQGNVQTTWNDLYDGLGRTSGATGKTSADVRARGAATREQADLGVLNAETADGKARAVATGIANTVGGLPGTTGVPTSITTYFTSFFNKLYGAGRSTPQTTISGDAISTVSATKIDGQIGNGQIANNAVTTAKLATGVVADIKSEVAAATVGSGAMLVRKGTTTQGATPTNRNKFTVGFFTDLVLSSPDITAVQEPVIFQGVNYGNFYNGTFQVANAGWYMVEVAFRVNSGFSAGFNVAPVLYRNGVAYKIGTDIIQTATRTSRYVQNSWIVYLAAGQNVGGGYDSSIGGSGINFFAADDTGIETYISISLLNRSLN